MDFELTEEQQDIKNAAKEFAKGEFDAEYARRCDLEHIYPRELVKKKQPKMDLSGCNFLKNMEAAGLERWMSV